MDNGRRTHQTDSRETYAWHDLDRTERYIIADWLEGWPHKADVIDELKLIRDEIGALRGAIENK
jgi:hypothetical protein